MVYPHPEKVHERTAEMIASGMNKAKRDWLLAFPLQNLRTLNRTKKNIISHFEDSRGIKFIVFQNF